MFRVLVLCLALLAPSPVFAQDYVYPSDVGQSTARHYPTIKAAMARRNQAIGRELEARGAFDTVIGSEARARLDGFYSGDYAAVDVMKPFGPLGGEVYGGYRLSQGDFPIYEDYNFTNQGGEAKIGILFSLLRDRAIDARRAGIIDAEFGVDAAELDILLEQAEVQQSALTTYYRWVARGRELTALEGLLDLAETRDVALRRQVQQGAVAAITVTENLQNLTRRRELVRRAEQDLALAANNLSLFLRDESGEPIVPTREQLPPVVPVPDTRGTMAPEALLAGRPDLQLIEIAQQRLEIERDLARNALQPSLDFRVEASQDIGEIGPGGVSRDPGELVAGVTFSVPLGRREAKGRVRATDAAMEALEQEQRLLRDQIVQQLQSIVITMRTAEDVLELTRLESEQAETMRLAEVERFRSGASDFFLVNVREQAAANAQIRVVQAEFALAAARLAYQAATFDPDLVMGR